MRDIGHHLDVTFAEYTADPAPAASLSSSIANLILSRSALHGKTRHPRLTEQPLEEESGTMDAGTVAHAMLLGGLDSVVSVDPRDFAGARGGIPKGWTNDAIRAERDRIRAAKKTPVLVEVYEQCVQMAEIAREKLRDCELPIDLADGWCESTLIWKETDVYCRARPDWMRKDRRLLVDYKTTATSAEPNAWIRRQLTTMGYDLQTAHYLRGNYMTGGSGASDFLFLVQENEPPYACSIVGLSGAKLEIAEQKRDEATQMWRHYMRTGNWPGYSNRICYAEPMSYETGELKERASVDELLEKGEQA